MSVTASLIDTRSGELFGVDAVAQFQGDLLGFDEESPGVRLPLPSLPGGLPTCASRVERTVRETELALRLGQSLVEIGTTADRRSPIARAR